MKKRLFATLLCLCLLAGLAPNMGLTAQAAGTAIGQTVEFSGYEWYIIGTETEGVTAPEGCYTLFAKDNKFGSTTFRAGADEYDSGANIYQGSDLQQAMERIAQDDNYFSDEDRNNIVPRNTSDAYIAGDFPAGQLLWPISASGRGSGGVTNYYVGEVTAIDSSLLKFETSYWTRSNWTKTPTMIDAKTYYHAITVSSDGGVVIYGLGQDAAVASQVTEEHAIRPALYVKQAAVTFVGTFQVGADVISKASVGGGLVANTGTDTPLLTDSGQSADVKVRLVDQSQSGENLAFRLFPSGTTTGADQVLACVLTGSTGAVQYYGKLADCSGTLTNSFNISVPMTGVADGTYTLSIFAHNTADHTISAPSPTMTVTVSDGTGTVSAYEGGTYVDGGTVESIRFTQHPQSLLEVKTNETATFSVEAVDSTGSDESVTYTWQVQRADEQGGWYTILDASTGQSYNNSSITFKNLTGTWAENGYSLEILQNPDDDFKISNGFHIRCQAKKSSSTGISDVATLTVDPAPAFTQQPQDQTAAAGGSTSFRAEAASIGGVTYTWQAQPKTSDPKLNMWYDIYSYASTGVSFPYREQTLYLPNVSGSWQDNGKILYDGSGYVYASTFDPAEARFRCVATDESGTVTYRAYSDPAELTVTGGTPTDPGPVTAVAGYGGTINQTTYTATASSGFVIDQMWVDGAEIATASGRTSYTPANTPADSVFVTFAYTVNFNTPAGGSLSVTRGGVTLTSGTIVRPGDELTITAAPDSGYTLSSLTVNGTPVTAANGVYPYTVGAQPTATRTVGGAEVAAAGATITAAFAESGAAPQEFTITFDGNGGTDPAPRTTVDGRLTGLPASTRTGYDFLGWYTEPGGGAQATASTVFTADATLYAHWRAQSGGGNSGGGSSGPVLPSTDASSGWPNIREEIGGAEAGDAITVDMNGGTEVPGAVLEEAAGTDVTLELDLGGGVSWTIDGRDLPEGVPLSDLDLGVRMDAGGISADVINTVSGEYGAVQVSLDHEGEFGFALTLTAPLGRENAGRWANLYHYDEGAERLTYVSSAPIAGNGSAALPMTHASQYAIVIDDTSHALPFEDVPPGHWAEEAVRSVWSKGLMAGTGGASFAPDGAATRGQIVTILWRMADSPQVNFLMDYSDVDPAAWYAEAVRWAAAEGIAGGYGGGRFGPDDPVTREQLAVMLHGFARHAGYDRSAGAEAGLLPYADAAHVSEYAVSALEWACGAGILHGTGDGSTLSPQGTATRAQTAVMIQRLCQIRP